MSVPLDFTGERFTPECVREIWYEHFHRYAFAWPVAKGRRVLDAACGEGYGSAVLADAGVSVLGVDISDVAIDHARNRYAHQSNLRFMVADVTALDALESASFDLIVSFETLEHVEEQERMLAGFQRLLAPDGVLIVSSPDKAQYSDASGHVNPFHVRELYRDELESLLARHFPATRLFAQKLVFQGALWRLDGPEDRVASSTMDAGETRPQQGLSGFKPMYYLAVCARSEALLESLGMPSVHLFGDRAESVYTHYNREVARIIEAGHVLVERDARIATLESEVAELRAMNEAAGSTPGQTPASVLRSAWPWHWRK